MQEKDGVLYEVIDLKKISDNEDMGKYGFRSGLKKNQLRLSVHMLDTREMAMGLSTLKTLQNPANNGVLSETIIAPNASRTYKDRKHGVILSQLSSKILTADYKNISSGYQKNLSSFLESFFTNASMSLAASQASYKGYFLYWIGLYTIF